MRHLTLLTATFTLLLAGPAAASDVDSGPAKGATIPALKVYDCTGDNKDQSIDHAALSRDRVAVYLLVAADRFDRPMNRFMKTLDRKVAEGKLDVSLVAVWLTDDEEKTKQFLPRVQQSVQYEKTPLTLFKGKDGPKDWNVNGDAHLTVLVANRGKVVARFGYRSVNDADVPAVLGELKKLAKKPGRP